MPMTERARTGLSEGSKHKVMLLNLETNSQADVILDARTSHKNHHNGSKE